MKTSALALAATLLAASFGTAYADSGEPNPVALSSAQLAAGQSQSVVEGRQAAPIAAQGSALSALDHYLIDRVDTSK